VGYLLYEMNVIELPTGRAGKATKHYFRNIPPALCGISTQPTVIEEMRIIYKVNMNIL
jgi:hypothetical protein